MSRTVIRGGTVLDQSGERRADVAIEDGCVVEVAPSLDGDVTLDASDCMVAPGLVDLHVHLREPGREEAETIETGSRAAALGGFTAVVAMPNTEPAQDSLAVIEFVRAQARRGRTVRRTPRGLHHHQSRRCRAGAVRRARRRRRAPVHRRRQWRTGSATDAARAGIRPCPRHHAGAALRGRIADQRCGDARGFVLRSSWPARLACNRGGVDGAPRHRVVASHRCAGSSVAPFDGAAVCSSFAPRRPTDCS